MKSNFLSSTAEIARPTRRLTILAQDPSLRDRRKNVITAAIDVPNEQLSAGPRGYRVQVVDYDSSTNKMYVALDAAKYGSVDRPDRPVRSHSKCEVAHRSAVPRAERLRDRHADAGAVRARARPARQLELRRSPAEGRAARLRRGQRVLLGRRGSAAVWLFRGQERIGLHVAVARHRRARDHACARGRSAAPIHGAVEPGSGGLPRGLRGRRGAALGLLDTRGGRPMRSTAPSASRTRRPCGSPI